MVNTQEEIMLTLNGQDNASQMFANVDKNAQGMASNIMSAMKQVNVSMMNIGQVTDNLMQGLTGKSALDNILGTSSKAETNQVLLKNMLDDAEKNYDDFYKTVDSVTDSSLTSMQELIPALKAFKSATAASDSDVQAVTDDMANFGAAVLAQTGSTELAQGAMMDLSKGIKGAFAALDQYGITEDSLKRNGWSGEEDDVKGYMKAVTKVTGSTDALMETNQGLDALIGKAFSRAGKKMGNEFLPVLKEVKKGFLDLDTAMGGNLTASILAVSGGVEVMNQGLWNITTTVDGVKSLGDVFKFITGNAKNAEDAIKGVSGAAETVGNVSSMGADAMSMGAGAGEVVKTTGKSEKAFEGGMDALMMADLLKGNKESNKSAEDTIDELKKLRKKQDKIQDEMDYVSGFGSDLYNGYKSKFTKSSKVLKKMDFVDELGKSARGDAGSHSKGFLLDRIMNFKGFSKDFNKSAKDSAKNLKGVFEDSSEFMFSDDLLKEWERSEWGLTDAIKHHATSFGGKITGAFSTIKNFDYKGAITNPFKQMKNFINGGFDELLQGGLEKGFGGIGNIAKSIKGKFSSLGSSLLSIKDIDFTGKIKGVFSNLNKNLYQSISGFSLKDTLGSLKDKITGLKGAKEITESVKGAEEIAEGVSGIAGASSAMAATGPELEAAAAGGAAVEAGATGLAATFTSLMVPLLAVSAAIIIMIPIVSFIAAEAMIFIRLLADFMEALNFDSINLDGAVKGLKSLTTAFLWVGAAMLTLSAVNITTALAAVTSNFLGMTGPLQLAINSLTEAAELLKDFGTVGINPSVPSNLQKISDSLMSVSSAMLALTGTTITVGFSNFISWALGFGSVTGALEQAKNDIMNASTKLNEFAGLTPIPDEVANNIQNVCDSLASVGNAITALREMRDGVNWDDAINGLIGGIFGEGLNIQQALDDVKKDIQNAATSLSGWTDLPSIPEGLSEKITNISTALTGINEAFQTLRGFRDDNVWDDMIGGIFGETDIGTALGKVITDLNTAATKLGELKIDSVTEDTTTGITNIGDALNKLSEVASNLTSFPDMSGFDSSLVTTAVTNVQNIATELSKLSETAFTGDSVETMLGSLQTALQSLKDTLAGASGFTEVSSGIGSQIITGVTTGLSPLSSAVQGAVSSAISSAGPTATTGGNTLGTNATNGMKANLKLQSTMATEVGYALTAMTSRTQEFYDAGAALGKAANEGFQSQDAINPGSPGNLAHVMMDEVGYILDAMKSKYSTARNIAAGLGQTIYDGFDNTSLDMSMFADNGQFTAEHIGALETVVSKAPDKSDNRPVTIIVSEGAVNVDARNHTVKEAQRLMITAFEGMDTISNIDVNGA